MTKIVAVCGSGLGSRFMVEINLQEIVDKLGIDAEVSHTNLGSFDPINTDYAICGRDIADSIDFEKKIVLTNILDKEEMEEKIKSALNIK